MPTAELNDAQLVAESLGGNRDAFRQIVERYQTLISSLAYCATGSLSLSEDVAQETFVVAWKKLPELREPPKLRAWLCTIQKFIVSKEYRRQSREPMDLAGPLEESGDTPAIEAIPSEQAISREEESILWRSLEQMPEDYRVPLVLFYREHQSVASVAEQLELSPDAVKQRLARGRKMLQDEVHAFVEKTLARTAPDQTFSSAVLAVLPATAASSAATGAGLGAKGVGAAKSGFLAVCLAPLAPFLGIIAVALAQIFVVSSANENGLTRAKRGLKVIGFWAAIVGGAWIGSDLTQFLSQRLGWNDQISFAATVCFWWFYCGVLCTVMMFMQPGNTGTSAAPGSSMPLVVYAGAIITAVCWWPLRVAWEFHDYGCLATFAGMFVVLIGWMCLKTVRAPQANLAPAVGICSAVALLMDLVVACLRMDVWMAAHAGVSVAEIHEKYPLWIVPCLSVALILWAAAVGAWRVSAQRRAVA